MEQDFMGLSTVKVKTEVPDEPNDSAPVRGSMMQWPFSNKIPATSQFFSFDGARASAGAGAGAVPGVKDDNKPKTGFEALASTGLVTITTTEAVDPSQKSYSAVMQKNMVLDNQVGTHYTVTSYPGKPFDAQSHHRHESRAHPLSSPVHQSFLSSAGQNLIGSATPIPLSVPSFVPAAHSSPLVGTTELRGTSKSSGAPAQLTIFYAGSVCVYDDISPEKAQAIMLLAGNAPPISSIPAIPAVPVQAVPAVPVQPVQAVPIQSVQPVSAVQPALVRSSIVDSFLSSQSHSSKPCIPSPIPMTCHTPSVSAVATDATPLRAFRGMAPCSNRGEHPRQANTLGSAPAKLVPSAVPQFRKASLARFLEKRKERTLSAAPYCVDKQAQDCGSPGASGSRSISMNSSGSSAPLPAMN